MKSMRTSVNFKAGKKQQEKNGSTNNLNSSSMGRSSNPRLSPTPSVPSSLPSASPIHRASPTGSTSSRIASPSAFLTGVDFNSSRFSKAQTVEDAILPEFNPSGPTTPPNNNFLQILDNITQTFPSTTSSTQKFWTSSLAMPEYKELCYDGFWWVMENIVKVGVREREREKRRKKGEGGGGEEVWKGEGTTRRKRGEVDPNMAKYDTPLFRRMSTNYVRMFEKVPFSKKDYFFGHFPDVMSFTLLLSYHSAYPRSKSKIDDDGFKQNLLDLCNEWTTGFRTSSVARKGEHWVVDFDMSEGNKNDTATRLKQMDTSGMSPGTPGSGGVGGRRKLVLNSRGGKRATSGTDPASETKEDNERHTRPIRLPHTICHSPFVRTYMSSITGPPSQTLTFKVGLTFAPSRPVITYDNSKTSQKAKWHAENQEANKGKDGDLSLVRTFSKQAESSRENGVEGVEE
ncbi:hypothetical protein TrLO_g10638 [Triparma laevis f. longispina]|uniref:Uncharacterized protein n=1 Tax=Triparma laevis f. longispina TaxID=1714387 RepID=A0A9W7CFR9_9STRA|nr:hypothetical protein TrLO_g10638 [Triparma laevis f. longispina]